MNNKIFSDNLRELKFKLAPELLPYLEKPDGAALFLQHLPEIYSPQSIIVNKDDQRAWELVGLHYYNLGRPYEALPIFSMLYDHMLVAQEMDHTRIHKGMPLVFMHECYQMMGYPVLAKRFLMLTLCEDAIREEGVISPENSGVYFRLVWKLGFSDAELKRYASQIYELCVKYPSESLFPEWILQEIDKDWMTEFPTPQEATVYSINSRYVNLLINKLGEGTGTNLEKLADYLLSCMPGCRTTRRIRTHSTDFDIVCSMSGLDIDFRSEFGRYFVCECKDWQTPADFTTLAKFCRILDSIKSRFGILFSKNGLSGEGKTLFAEREQLKVFQDRGMVIIVVDLNDLVNVAKGSNFITILRTKYEEVRLDLLRTHSD